MCCIVCNLILDVVAVYTHYMFRSWWDLNMIRGALAFKLLVSTHCPHFCAKSLTNLFNYEYDCRMNLTTRSPVAKTIQNCFPGSIRGRGVICELMASYVGFLLCSKRFFSGYSGYFLSSKSNISKFQFDPVMLGHEFLWTPWCSVSKQITYLQLHMIMKKKNVRTELFFDKYAQ